MKERLALLIGIFTIVSLLCTDNQVEANPARFKKSCIKCLEYGNKFCGNYNNPYRYTKCGKTIPTVMCKT